MLVDELSRFSFSVGNTVCLVTQSRSTESIRVFIDGEACRGRVCARADAFLACERSNSMFSEAVSEYFARESPNPREVKALLK
jgi:hypothetical protein